MLKIDYEFRKGIFFIRFIGNMNKQTSLEYGKEIKLLLQDNRFKYVVINVNYVDTIDNDGIGYLSDIYQMTMKEHGYMVLCDKFKLVKKLFQNVPSIDSELEVL